MDKEEEVEVDKEDEDEDEDEEDIAAAAAVAAPGHANVPTHVSVEAAQKNTADGGDVLAGVEDHLGICHGRHRDSHGGAAGRVCLPDSLNLFAGASSWHKRVDYARLVTLPARFRALCKIKTTFVTPQR